MKKQTFSATHDGATKTRSSFKDYKFASFHYWTAADQIASHERQVAFEKKQLAKYTAETFEAEVREEWTRKFGAESAKEAVAQIPEWIKQIENRISLYTVKIVGAKASGASILLGVSFHGSESGAKKSKEPSESFSVVVPCVKVGE